MLGSNVKNLFCGIVTGILAAVIAGGTLYAGDAHAQPEKENRMGKSRKSERVQGGVNDLNPP